ncbi:MAG: LemA family protein [Niastella sp. SCN 39-18]|nr:LemA family protein [Sphingobacteriales bacterium]ODT53199.1 MAG: LemA family protein [Niastella sp. SCN 39-18]OJW08118.1 MAG: LemA family protein [Sphingobacteriales bacterium 39-19]
MQNKRSLGYIIGGVFVLLALYGIFTYNGFIKKEEKVNNQWAEVQNAYQRRLNLVPNLVSTVQGGASFESGVLEQIAEARSKASSVTVNQPDSETNNRQLAAQNELAMATNQLIARVERYPELKGTKAFAGLQVQLEGTERRIKVARKDFNESVQVYNTAIKTFPANIIASLFGFTPKDGFEASEGAEKAVEIKF